MKETHFINYYEGYKEAAKILKWCLTIVSICFVVSTWFIYSSSKNQKIIIIPPGADKRIEFVGNQMDSNTLKLWGKYISSLFLSYSPKTYGDQSNDLLKITTPSFYDELEQLLWGNKEEIESLSVSSTFYPESVEINREKREIWVEGQRLLIVNSEPITRNKKAYRFQYTIIDGKFFLDGISTKEP